MQERYRIEIYDDIKANDITIYSNENLDRLALSQLVFSYLPKFKGNVRSYIYDNKNKRKTAASFYPMEYQQIIK